MKFVIPMNEETEALFYAWKEFDLQYTDLIASIFQNPMEVSPEEVAEWVDSVGRARSKFIADLDSQKERWDLLWTRSQIFLATTMQEGEANDSERR